MPQFPQEWKVETAVPEHADSLAELHARSFKAAYHSADPVRNSRVFQQAVAFKTPERVELRAKIILRASANEDGEVYYEALDEKDYSVGFIYGTKAEEQQELVALYVHPAMTRRGIGFALTSAFIDWCDPQQAIEVGVARTNLRAQRFYEHFGFERQPGDRPPFYDYLPEITMLRLAGETHEI